MNALVQFRSNVAGTLSPTSRERQEVQQKLLANMNATLRGLQGKKPETEEVLSEEAKKSLSRTNSSSSSSTSGTKSTSETKSTDSDTDTTSTTSTNTELGKDEFLQLLVTQMQYQDPLDPVSNEDMIANLAQFSALEQMTNLNESFEELSATMTQQNLVSASNLIGKNIYGTDTEGETVNGEVESIYLSDGVAYACVGEQAIAVDDIQLIE